MPPGTLSLLRQQQAAPAPTTAAAAASAGAGSSGAAGGGGKQQRPWDNWSLPTLQGSQQQGKKKAKLSGELLRQASGLLWPSRACLRKRANMQFYMVCPKFNFVSQQQAPSQPHTHGPWAPGAALPYPTLPTMPAVPTGLLWEVSADLGWLGVSVVGPTHEVAYLRASGMRAELAGTAAHLVLDLELRHLQVGCVAVTGGGWMELQGSCRELQGTLLPSLLWQTGGCCTSRSVCVPSNGNTPQGLLPSTPLQAALRTHPLAPLPNRCSCPSAPRSWTTPTPGWPSP